ncbi:MAG: cupredoxin domain-containing protein [Nanoarchaeota archaeon]|nr:cupredoxin domain-containing protein [Nanoarchaeota archaeon]
MKKVIIGVFILAIVITSIFVVKNFTGNSVKNEDVKTFNVKAFRFGYSPDLIEVNKGDKVVIEIENTDTLHGIRIPDLGIKGNEVIEFTADKTGEFTWYCTNMCGEGHMQMQGKLIVK